MNRAIITLLTDFGTKDSYVAQMKGVLLSRCPDCVLVDISHDIPPQNVRAASRLLAEAVPRFPRQTVHVAVVDPGVGTDRSILAVHWADQVLVLPDNGLLTDLVQKHPLDRAYIVCNQQLFIPHVSPTFHGRDIIAPVAAFLASGGEIGQVGPAIDDFESLPLLPEATEDSRGGWLCRITAIDHFGNIALSSSQPLRDAVGSGTALKCAIIKDFTTLGLSKSFCLAKSVLSYGHAAAGEWVLLIDSQDRLELALVNGSAADELGIEANAQILICPE
jgi:S-adenosylmethionine hydrolase